MLKYKIYFKQFLVGGTIDEFLIIGNRHMQSNICYFIYLLKIEVTIS